MPTYEYKCTECNHTFEAFQKMSEEPLKECPLCKGQVKRLIGAGAGPIFKGSGFYQTDYKNNSPQKKEIKTSKPESKEKKTPDTTTKKDS